MGGRCSMADSRFAAERYRLFQAHLTVTIKADDDLEADRLLGDLLNHEALSMATWSTVEVDNCITVALDPSAQDWGPECFECKKPVAWADAVLLCAGEYEEDDPRCLVPIHRGECP